MAKTIGRNQNINDTAITSVVVLNSTTAVKIANANPNRIFFRASIQGLAASISMFIKLQQAIIDNLAQGIWLGIDITGNRTVFDLEWEMSPDNIYTGEISAIAGVGTPSICVVEY